MKSYANKVFGLRVRQADGDTTIQELCLNGEPYVLRTGWIEIKRLISWSNGEGGVKISVPIPEDMRRELTLVQEWVKEWAVIPRSCRGRRLLRQLAKHRFLVATYPEERSFKPGKYRFDIDLSRFIAGFIQDEIWTMRFAPIITKLDYCQC